MGRHADPSASRRIPRLSPSIGIAVAAVLALGAGGAVWATAGDAKPGPCASPTTVRVTVAPELDAVARALLARPLPTADGGCARGVVTAQQPLQTVGSLGALAAPELPQVWVPDSSLWAARAGAGALTNIGSMAVSPVVLATGRGVADRLGWTQTPPTWGQAVSSNQPLAVPDLAGSAEGLAALAAVRTSLGGNQAADDAVVQAVLAAARGPALSTEQALAAGQKDAADAPLVPVREQRVYAADHGATDPKLVAVYPSEGSPQLDYPVLRVSRSSPAVDAVVDRLLSARARSAVTKAGFRTSTGAGPKDAGADTGIHAVAPRPLPLDPAQVQQLLARLTSLAAPSRILSVFDVSKSMEAPVGDGTRVTLARDAAKSALALIPDTSSIGLWDFAYRLHGDDDWTSLVPTRRLDAKEGGKTQRELLTAALDSLPNRLSPGGTGLFDTTLAAVRQARKEYQPSSVSSVLLVTDGANDDDRTGLQLDKLLSTLRSEADPARPVKVIAVGLGPDADMGALKQIASATGGAAYSALDPKDLQTVLFDALRQRG
jgi:Ca-activated chloride channel homolog